MQNFYDLTDTKIEFKKKSAEADVNFESLFAIYSCRVYNAKLYSNNKLHCHNKIRICSKLFENSFVISIEKKFTNVLLIIEFIFVNVNQSDDYFRSWHYTTFKASISLNKFEKSNSLCANIECTMSLTDRKFVKQEVSNSTIHCTDISIKMREIEINLHDSFEYVLLDFYITERSKKDSVTAYF